MKEILEQKSERLISIAKEALTPGITESQLQPLRDEAKVLFREIPEEFNELKRKGCDNLPTDAYFNEKLSGVRSFVRMAMGVEERGGYPDKQILDNVNHYAYLLIRD